VLATRFRPLAPLLADAVVVVLSGAGLAVPADVGLADTGLAVLADTGLAEFAAEVLGLVADAARVSARSSSAGSCAVPALAPLLFCSVPCSGSSRFFSVVVWRRGMAGWQPLHPPPQIGDRPAFWLLSAVWEVRVDRLVPGRAGLG
jgi:hypothetical protein